MGRAREYAESCWQTLAREFGVRFLPDHSPAPHLMLYAGRADGDRFIDACKRVAKETNPFEITANGIGVFAVERPVLYLRWRLCPLWLSYADGSGAKPQAVSMKSMDRVKTTSGFRKRP